MSNPKPIRPKSILIGDAKQPQGELVGKWKAYYESTYVKVVSDGQVEHNNNLANNLGAQMVEISLKSYNEGREDMHKEIRKLLEDNWQYGALAILQAAANHD